MEVHRNSLASIFGISPRAVNDLETRGLVVKEGFDTYHLQKSVTAYVTHLREIAAGRGGESAGQNLTAERARLAAVQAEEKAIKVAKAKGELVLAEGVAREWAAILQKVRAGLLAVSPRIAARLTHLSASDVSEIDHEIRAALTELGTDG